MVEMIDNNPFATPQVKIVPGISDHTRWPLKMHYTQAIQIEKQPAVDDARNLGDQMKRPN